MASTPSEVHFSVDSQLIGELGERLVTKNHVALSELIKNAYDADSKEIRIFNTELKDLVSKVKRPSIVIEDRGVGMSVEEVKEHWMRIATSNKSRNPVSEKYGRPKTGNKGIGRFSCQRLAKQLRLITTKKTKNGYETTSVDFIWSEFEPGKELSEVPCTYRVYPAEKRISGTRLELIGLRDEWNNRDWFTLRRTVTALSMVQETKRAGYKPDPGFDIEFNVPGVESVTGRLREQVLDAGWGRVKGVIDEDGVARFELDGKYLRGTQRHQLPKNYRSLKGLRLDIAWINRGWKDDLLELNRDRRILSGQVISEFAQEAGIRVYDGGFRVFPFGEHGNDWLDLDRDYARRLGSFNEKSLAPVSSAIGLSARRVGLLRPRSDNLIGSVFVSSKTMRLETNMDREGFIKNRAFDELQEVVKAAVEFAALFYAYAKTLKEENEVQEAVEAFSQAATIKAPASPKEVVNEAVRYISTAAKSGPSKAGDSKDSPVAIDSAARVITAHYSAMDAELEVLRAIASSAPLLFMFSHEVNNLISRLDSGAMMIEDAIEWVDDEEAINTLQATAAFLRKSSQSFSKLSELFGFVSRAKLEKPKRILARKLLNSLIEGTHFSTQAAGIKVGVECEKYLKTPVMKEAEFVSIAANLYSNALKSVYAKDGGNIQIEAFESEKEFVFQIKDSGVGLSKAHWKEVLRPFVSDPEDKIYSKLQHKYGNPQVSALGKGTGLGLSVVKGIADAYQGKLEISRPAGWSLCVAVKLPKRKDA